MKNREKYKNELRDVIKMDGRICGFVIKHGVFQMFGTDKKSFCGETDCPSCTTALQLWLDEECEMSETDWIKVPVDTLVKVRDSQSEDWKLGFFKGFYPQNEFKFATWTNGETSKTGYDYEVWMYCDLVEEV